MNKNVMYVTRGGLIAALYVLLTMVSTAFGLSSGAIQVRFSEALCVLPMFFPEAVPGLFIGCILSNLLSGCVIWDVVFGSIATLIGAIGTRLLRKNKWLALIPPILSNSFIVPIVLIKAYGVESGFWFLVLTVFLGEFVSAGILGILVHQMLNKTARFTN